MKKKNIILALAALLAAAPIFAAPSFSGAIGGSVGFKATVPTSGGSADFDVPMAGFAAVQANLTDWCVARGEIAVSAANFNFDDIFASATADIRLNELSVVMIRRAVTTSSFFSAFLGSYERLGSDTFLMRQFGVEPISSHFSKSATSISGAPLVTNKGAGISYIVNFDKLPMATGGYIYVGKNRTDDWTINIDTRFSFVSNIATLDFMAGVGSPLQDTYNNEDVVLMIDTITLKGGINLLLGSKFTHALLLQAGVNDVVVKGKEAGTIVGDEIRFLVEPRLNFNKFRLHFTLYTFDAETVSELIYLPDEIGAAVTLLKDDIETKRGMLTAGIHLIGGISGVLPLKYFDGTQLHDGVYNVYITPYVEVPLTPTSKAEAMAQIGMRDIAGERKLDFKVLVSARKVF